MQKNKEIIKQEAVEAENIVETKEEVKVAEPDAAPEKENMTHRAKRYLRVIIIFVVLFIGGSILGIFLSGVLTFDSKQQKLLKEEIAEIGTLTNAETLDYQKIYGMLDETVTTDEYVPLEKAVKGFTKDVIATTQTVDEAMDTSIIETALTAENISADAPNFTNTLAELDSVYTTLETAKADFQILMTEEKVLSYLPKDTEEKYVEVYKEIVSGVKMTESDDRYIQMIESIDKMLTTIDAERAAINYLVTNQNQWKVKDGLIYFNTQQQVSEYNTLLAEFTTLLE